MYLFLVLSLHTLWVAVSIAMQHGHYDMCKTQTRSDEVIVWEYMACQPESKDMTPYLKVKLDPPNSTCGDPPEPFCAMGNPYMCNNECDASTKELAHPPELMFDSEGRNPSTFWQSVTWKNYPAPLQINVTLSWGKTIELTQNIAITFESGRPEKMILEKSLDYGLTWQPYQFYAADCLDAFRMEPKSVKDLSASTVLDIICTEEYSTGYAAHTKTISFEIKDRFAIFAGPRLHNMASLYSQLDTTKNLRDFFTVTDLRIRLLKPATGATFVDETKLGRYFYAISDIKIHGRCKCNLHANSCTFTNNRLACDCEHNTTGQDCERCKKNYQGQAWSAGSYLTIPKGTANICVSSMPSTVQDKKRKQTITAVFSKVAHSTVPPARVSSHKRDCYCYGHSSRCTYIEVVNTAVCVGCRHNTHGQQCEKCKKGFHRNGSAKLDDVNVCLANICDNELLRCQNGGICHNNMRCLCPPGYTGILCEHCEDKDLCFPKSGQSGQESISHNLYLITMIIVTQLCTF
ncbi:PREDICTED: netrin-G1 isoform X3 [Nanorana parkeri]|uniref:netrin-G1 isoform X3 n=1 Tax=Nanorana parkeri TaxID=125878 RepID=UPI0008547892|nr:PREDICTED: netrin-G1 isoform X3 [Nanorana parkeri]